MPAPLETVGLEFMGRDWCHVYRSSTEDRPCLVCRRPTRLLLVFKPSGGTSLAICGSCRGY